MTKKELAFRYSPETSYSAAISRLQRWINGDPELLQSLHAAGYIESQRVLTPRQVAIIYDFLGTPGEFSDAL